MNARNFPFSPLWRVTLDLSTHPDCSEVWPSERRGAEAVDPGHHWSPHRPRLPERDEEWSHSVRVRTFAELRSTKMSLSSSEAVLVQKSQSEDASLSSSLPIRSGKCWCLLVWKVNIFVAFRLINHLAPGSVKKINKSSLNWHQVSFWVGCLDSDCSALTCTTPAESSGAV